MHPLSRRALRPRAIQPSRAYAAAAKYFAGTKTIEVPSLSGGSKATAPSKDSLTTRLFNETSTGKATVVATIGSDAVRNRASELAAKRRAEREAREAVNLPAAREPTRRPSEPRRDTEPTRNRAPRKLSSQQPAAPVQPEAPKLSLSERLAKIRAGMESVKVPEPSPSNQFKRGQDSSRGQARSDSRPKFQPRQRDDSSSGEREYNAAEEMDEITVALPSGPKPIEEISPDLFDIFTPAYKSVVPQVSADIAPTKTQLRILHRQVKASDYSRYAPQDPAAYSTLIQKLGIPVQVSIATFARGIPTVHKQKVNGLVGDIVNRFQRK